MGLTILAPILPLIKSGLGISSGAVQQLLTSYLIALAVGQLIWGPLSDRHGRRLVLMVGALFYTLGGVAVVVTSDVTMLVVFRCIQGFGAGACMAMARAMINDAFDRDEAARQMSTISMVLSVAPAVSLAFSGWMAEVAGWKSTMLILIACGGLLLLFGFRFGHETHFNRLKKIDLSSVFTAYKAVLSKSLFNLWTLTSGMQVGMFFCLNSILAYQYQRHGYTLSEFGYWFSLTPLFYLLGNTCNRNWFVSRGIERAALIGCSGSLVSSILMLVTQSVGMTHALSLALPCCLFGFCNGIIVANSTVGAITASGNHRGTGTGIVGAWQMATGGIAGALIVWLGGAQNFTIAIGCVIAMACASVMSMLSVYRRIAVR